MTGFCDPAAPRVGVLALQGDVAEHLRALAAVGARAVAVRSPDQLDDIGGLIIPGGESTTIWKLAVAFDLMEPVRKRVGPACPRSAAAPG